MHFRKWLSSSCSPLPFDDSEKAVRIPSWHFVQIRNIIPHSSHNLLSHKGIVFCESCGAYSIKRCRLLAHPCAGICTLASERAKSKLLSGELPAKGLQWPQRNQLQLMRPAAADQPCAQPRAPTISHAFDDAEDFSLFDDPE